MHEPAIMRRDKLLSQYNDVYRERKHLPEPTICKECGSVFERGRWTWNTVEVGISGGFAVLCPACRRIRDGIPAGDIQISGDFYLDHADEIEHRVRNLEESEKRRHPLERIMSLERYKSGIHVTTTGVHVARRIAGGLRKAFKGDVSFSRSRDDRDVKISWQR